MSAPVEVYHHPIAQRDDWATPPTLFAKWDREFAFTLDAAALPENAKCARYFTPRAQCRACGGDGVLHGVELDACRFCDGLAQSWAGERVWLNPPYGRQIGAWIRKAWEESQKGERPALVACLVPARTCSAWWHDYAAKGEVQFIRGRIRFVGAPYNAPFPSALVVFWPLGGTP